MQLVLRVYIVWAVISSSLLAGNSQPPNSCVTKQDARAWNSYLSRHFRVVFPDGNRNFGGSKWFELCEERFWKPSSWEKLRGAQRLAAETRAKELMRCCSRSYCPYSGAIAGGAARKYDQALPDYCINDRDAVSVCCSPCICHLGPGKTNLNPRNMPFGLIEVWSGCSSRKLPIVGNRSPICQLVTRKKPPSLEKSISRT